MRRDFVWSIERFGCIAEENPLTAGALTLHFHFMRAVSILWACALKIFDNFYIYTIIHLIILESQILCFSEEYFLV